VLLVEMMCLVRKEGSGLVKRVSGGRFVRRVVLEQAVRKMGSLGWVGNPWLAGCSVEYKRSLFPSLVGSKSDRVGLR
jgi:hypothetical protein